MHIHYDTVPIDAIQIHREARQRRELPEDHIAELAASISERDLLVPIIVKSDAETPGQFTLAAGECRLTAWRRNRESNAPRPPSLGSWEEIPCAIIPANTTPEELEEIEFVENRQRRQLSWQDECRGILRIHKLHTARNQRWGVIDTAARLSVAHSTVSRMLRIAEAISGPNEELATLLNASNGWRGAAQVLERYENRRRESLLDAITDEPRAEPVTNPRIFGIPQEAIRQKPTPPTETDRVASAAAEEAIAPADASLPSEPPPPISPFQIFCQDFIEIAPYYSGEKINFLHADFPYGINLFSGPGMNTAADNLANPYDDSPEIYWELLDALARNQETLLSSSCHIMFWFSPSLREETVKFFRTAFPAARIHDFEMIWHKSDNAGLIPDPQRYGRRTYESALLITLGDRKIVAPKALSFAHPGKWSTKVHRSEKPLEVLRHFFSMFVDSSSVVADFTCGSGTSIRAAEALGAKSALGLEIDEERATLAQRLLRNPPKPDPVPTGAVADNLLGDLGL